MHQGRDDDEVRRGTKIMPAAAPPKGRQTNMTKCSYCGTRILFGGKAHGDRRFCNETCYRKQALVDLSKQVPEDAVHKSVWDIHQGRCPKCGGNGPVDVHVSYRVWSALVLTSWQSVL